MGISAVNNIPDIMRRTNAEILPDNVGLTDNQPVQEPNRGWSENIRKVQFSEEKINKAIEQANELLTVHNTRLEFSIHEKTQEIMVKVLDENTGEVIRETPPQKVLDMIAMLWTESGLMVDKKV